MNSFLRGRFIYQRREKIDFKNYTPKYFEHGYILLGLLIRYFFITGGGGVYADRHNKPTKITCRFTTSSYHTFH